jgi:hypothetical protein
MSDVTSHYIVRSKNVAVSQYESLRSALCKVIQHSGWVVHQRSFVAGARSLNEEEFKENLQYFKVPSVSIDSIRTKLAMTIFDEYANILKGMYSIRTTVDPTLEAPPLVQTPEDPTTGSPQSVQLGISYLLSSTLSRSGSLTNLGIGRREGVRRRKSN